MVTLLVAAAATTAVHAAELQSIEVEVGRPSTGRLVGTVDVPPAEVLAIVLDCASTGDWFPDLVDTHVVGVDRCAGATDLPWPMADRTWAIDVWVEPQGEAWLAGFAYVPGSGDLASMEGHWLLEPTEEGGTRVTYEVSIDLGFWIPEPLVGWATRRVMPGILDGLEAQASVGVARASVDDLPSSPSTRRLASRL